MKVVFFGTPAFAAPLLTGLISSPHRVEAVVTQPDRPRGRGQRVSEEAVARLAQGSGIPILQPERLKDAAFLETLAGFGADLGVVAAYGRILPDAVLSTPRLGLINVHASLLPRYRGAAPIQRAILAGETCTGVTIMRIVAALDAGPIFAAEPVTIGADDTSVELERRLAEAGVPLLLRVMDAIERGDAVETPQDDRLATYAPRLAKHEGVIDWNQSAAVIHDKVRGLHPWPHACTFLAGARYILLQSAVAAGGSPPVANEPPGHAPGTILEAAGSSLVVAAGSGSSLRILRIQPEGRRPMTAREFLAGHPLPSGLAFGAG